MGRKLARPIRFPHHITVRLTKTQFRTLERKAKQTKTNRAEIIRSWLDRLGKTR